MGNAGTASTTEQKWKHFFLSMKSWKKQKEKGANNDGNINNKINRLYAYCIQWIYEYVVCAPLPLCARCAHARVCVCVYLELDCCVYRFWFDCVTLWVCECVCSPAKMIEIHFSFTAGCVCVPSAEDSKWLIIERNVSRRAVYRDWYGYTLFVFSMQLLLDWMRTIDESTRIPLFGGSWKDCLFNRVKRWGSNK